MFRNGIETTEHRESPCVFTERPNGNMVMIIIVISLPLHFPFFTSKKREMAEKNRKEMKPIEMSGKKHMKTCEYVLVVVMVVATAVVAAAAAAVAVQTVAANAASICRCC